MTPSGIGLMAPHWRDSTRTGEKGNLITTGEKRTACTSLDSQESGMTSNAK